MDGYYGGSPLLWIQFYGNINYENKKGKYEMGTLLKNPPGKGITSRESNYFVSISIFLLLEYVAL
jgi:hypothetical protein